MNLIFLRFLSTVTWACLEEGIMNRLVWSTAGIVSITCTVQKQNIMSLLNLASQGLLHYQAIGYMTGIWPGIVNYCSIFTRCQTNHYTCGALPAPGLLEWMLFFNHIWAKKANFHYMYFMVKMNTFVHVHVGWVVAFLPSGHNGWFGIVWIYCNSLYQAIPVNCHVPQWHGNMGNNRNLSLGSLNWARIECQLPLSENMLVETIYIVHAKICGLFVKAMQVCHEYTCTTHLVKSK
jgi:hypothetical protein